jgi:hypothetical protein
MHQIDTIQYISNAYSSDLRTKPLCQNSSSSIKKARITFISTIQKFGPKHITQRWQIEIKDRTLLQANNEKQKTYMEIKHEGRRTITGKKQKYNQRKPPIQGNKQ